MKLALISHHDTVQGQEALKTILDTLEQNSPRVDYIASQPDPQREYFNHTRDIYHRLGADVSEYIELEAGFDPHRLERLFDCPAIHLSGGNTFRFLRWLRHRKLESRLVDYVRSGGVLIGVSAGAMIMTPSIETAYLCGDENTPALTEMSGLNLVSFLFVPHISLDGPALSASLMQTRKLKPPVFLCSDLDSILIINEEIHILGNPVLALQGKVCRPDSMSPTLSDGSAS